MRVRLAKKQNRNELTCVRADGSHVTANLGPGLPHHDLAHYVVETHLQLDCGFFGNIARGYSFADLSNKEVIGTLGGESLSAEILSRALQSLHSGACSAHQFPELIRAELGQWSIPMPQNIDAASGNQMLLKFRDLLHRFESLKDREALELDFSPHGP